MKLAHVLKTTIGLSNLSQEAQITLAPELPLKGEMNEHSVRVVL